MLDDIIRDPRIQSSDVTFVNSNTNSIDKLNAYAT